MAKTPQPVRQIDYDAQVASQGVIDTDQNVLIATRQIDSIITNPSFDIWQRGIGPFIDTGYTTDRFSITTGRKLQLDRSVDVPTWSPSKYSVELTNTSIVTAPASYTTRLVHRVEGYNIRRLKNSNMTFSFNVKGNFSGQSSITMFNSAEDQSLVETYNITTNWTRVSIVIPKNDFSVGGWNIENGLGLDISWNLESSTDLQTATLGQWLNTLAFGHADDYKFNDTVGNKVWISDVALHVGEQPIVFDKLMRDYATELKLCQRYYEKSFSLSVKPSNGTSSLDIIDYGNVSRGISSNAGSWIEIFLIEKRVVPSMTKYGSSGGNWIFWSNNTTRVEGGNINISSSSTRTFNVSQQATTNIVSFEGHWTANAEL